ncbi:DUF2185 domain-containing protein [Microbacterium sp. 16-032]|jgi:hypothetical protein|uniref:DUF2185 domain-containing protein n=1 Tax=Microbacterium sp. 16-032 TaxID=3239808 RepID=UPI0034E283B3
MSSTTPEFVRESGASIASRRVLDGSAPLKWAVREAPSNPSDNGWRFFSEVDDESYLDDPSNLEVASFNTIAAIEPAVIPLFNMPVGTDLAIIRDRGAIRFFDNETGREVPASDLG